MAGPEALLPPFYRQDRMLRTRCLRTIGGGDAAAADFQDRRRTVTAGVAPDLERIRLDGVQVLVEELHDPEQGERNPVEH